MKARKPRRIWALMVRCRDELDLREQMIGGAAEGLDVRKVESWEGQD